MNDPEWPHGYGKCHCGCGGSTTIPRKSNAPRGIVRGRPLRFVGNHVCRMPRRRPPIRDWVFARVDQSGGEDACWPWTGVRDRKGYGRYDFREGGRLVGTTGAHRIVWALVHGPIPEGMEVCHHCDNPPCCNPAHLFLGTHAENMADRDRKGRCPHVPLPKDRQPRGEKHGHTTLTAEQALDIKRRGGEGTNYRLLSEEYGVTRGTIHNIVRGKTWGHLDGATRQYRDAASREPRVYGADGGRGGGS